MCTGHVDAADGDDAWLRRSPALAPRLHAVGSCADATTSTCRALSSPLPADVAGAPQDTETRGQGAERGP